MNTDPITAVVAALRLAYHDGKLNVINVDFERRADALLRDLARLQRPVAWRVHFQKDDGAWIVLDRWESMPVAGSELLSLRRHPHCYRIEYAYSSLPGANAS